MVYNKRSFQTTRKIALVDRATRMEEPDSCFGTWVNTLLLIIRPLWAVYIRLFTFGFLSLLLGLRLQEGQVKPLIAVIRIAIVS